MICLYGGYPNPTSLYTFDLFDIETSLKPEVYPQV